MIRELHNAILLTVREGGAVLGALIVLAVMIYALVFGIWRHVRATENRLRRLDREAATDESRREVERRFAGLDLDEMAWVERRLPFLAVLIGAAPLLGLLGTVAGMLITFEGMASAGSEPLDTISRGISKALVTTQAGLVIAIPAAFLLALLRRKTESARGEMERKMYERLIECHGEEAAA